MPSKVVAERKRRAKTYGSLGLPLIVNANSGVVHLRGCPMEPGTSNRLGWRPSDAEKGDKGCVLCFNERLPEPCGTCEGWGVVGPEEREEDCPNCNGSGCAEHPR